MVMNTNNSMRMNSHMPNEVMDDYYINDNSSYRSGTTIGNSVNNNTININMAANNNGNNNKQQDPRYEDSG